MFGCETSIRKITPCPEALINQKGKVAHLLNGREQVVGQEIILTYRW